MNEVERNQHGLKLAGLIGDTPPILRDNADLLAYRKYVESIHAFNQTEADLILLQARLADPHFAADLKKKQDKHWEGINHRATLPKMGAAALRKKGAQTRAEVVEAWHTLSGRPECSRASLIAQRLRLSARAVRGHLQRAGLSKNSGNFKVAGL